MFAVFDENIRRQVRHAVRSLRAYGVEPLAFTFALGAVQLALAINVFVKIWIIQEADGGLGEALSITVLLASYIAVMAVATNRTYRCLAEGEPALRRRALAKLVTARRKEELFGRQFSVFIALGAMSAFPDLMLGGTNLQAEAAPILALTVVDAARQYWFC